MKRKEPAWRRKGFAFEPGTTHFLAVDLDVESGKPLDALVAAFGKKVFVRHLGPIGPRRHAAYLSLAGSRDRTADQLTRALCALVTRLPKPARGSWDRARSRRFDIGIEAGHSPRSHAVELDPRTIAAVASVGGSIVVTTYAPEPPAKPRRLRRAPRLRPTRPVVP